VSTPHPINITAATTTLGLVWLGAHAHQIEAIKALTPGVLVQRFFDATLGGLSPGLGLVDGRFG
jgi:hypothetical protein